MNDFFPTVKTTLHILSGEATWLTWMPSCIVKIDNRRTVFEQTIFTLLRVLYALQDDHEDTNQLLADVLDKEPSLLKPLDGVADQY